MTEQIEYIKSNGFKIPKSTSETVRAHLYLLGRHGAVIYRPTKNEDVSEEFKSVAQSLGITIFSNNHYSRTSYNSIIIYKTRKFIGIYKQ